MCLELRFLLQSKVSVHPVLLFISIDKTLDKPQTNYFKLCLAY